MRAGRKEFERRNARVALVTMASAEDTAGFCEGADVPFTCLADPDREAYRAFGLERGGISELLGPRNWTRGVKAVLEGHVQGATVGDPRQMPGAFVFDGDGVVRYAHYAREVSDNPSNDELFEVLDAL